MTCTRTVTLLFALATVAGCPSDDTGEESDCAEPVVLYADVDGDGFGDSSMSNTSCESGSGWVLDNSDCDDSDSSVSPEAEEVCDDVDNDCNGTVDDEPVCTPMDDVLEDNDTRETASIAEDTDDLVAVAGDDDWFVIDLCGRGSATAVVSFTHADGDINLEAYNAEGTRIVTRASEDDDETVDLANPNFGPSVVYLRVFMAAGGSNAYDLAITLDESTCVEEAVNIDVSAELTDDVVYNNAGIPDSSQDSMDFDGNVYLTETAAGTGGTGLPDDAFFPATGEHPDITLGWDNAEDGGNGRVLLPGDSVLVGSLSIEADVLHVFGLGTQGDADVLVAWVYADGTTGSQSVTFGDWFGNIPVGAGSYSLVSSLNRWEINNESIDARANFSIWGHAIAVDRSAVIRSISVSNDAADARFVFLGMTAE